MSAAPMPSISTDGGAGTALVSGLPGLLLMNESLSSFVPIAHHFETDDF